MFRPTRDNVSPRDDSRDLRDQIHEGLQEHENSPSNGLEEIMKKLENFRNEWAFNREYAEKLLYILSDVDGEYSETTLKIREIIRRLGAGEKITNFNLTISPELRPQIVYDVYSRDSAELTLDDGTLIFIEGNGGYPHNPEEIYVVPSSVERLDLSDFNNDPEKREELAREKFGDNFFIIGTKVAVDRGSTEFIEGRNYHHLAKFLGVEWEKRVERASGHTMNGRAVKISGYDNFSFDGAHDPSSGFALELLASATVDLSDWRNARKEEVMKVRNGGNFDDEGMTRRFLQSKYVEPKSVDGVKFSE